MLESSHFTLANYERTQVTDEIPMHKILANLAASIKEIIHYWLFTSTIYRSNETSSVKIKQKKIGPLLMFIVWVFNLFQYNES